MIHLYKAKRKDNGEWMEFDPFKNQMLFTFKKACKVIDSGGDWHYIDLNTLCKFIGLTDNNKRKVFEHDNLDSTKYPEDSPCPYAVIFEDGSCRKKYEEWDETLTKPIINQFDLDLLNDEIIGNIHDNSNRES